MNVNVEFISSSCNCTYNCLELTENFVLFGGHHALVIYDLQEQKIVKTAVSHKGSINCVRFLKNSKRAWVLTCAVDGSVILWKYSDDGEASCLETVAICNEENNVLICDGIVTSGAEAVIAYGTSRSKLVLSSVSLEGSGDLTFCTRQIIDLRSSIALDLVFHQLVSGLILAIGKESGTVSMYKENSTAKELEFKELCNLRKHEDWVRCIAFCQLGGQVLLASGGQDSFIAIWRFVETKNSATNEAQQFEFQSYQFDNFSLVFDAMIIGHEGRITSLDFNAEGKLLSCSNDQSIILWSNIGGDIWTEEARLGSVGGETPGGFGAKLTDNTIVSWGFQGAIQIWTKDNDDWQVQPSVTGHFGQVTDLDFHPDGHYLVTTSHDETTRIFSPWGFSRWHEIARPQIHGHPLCAVKCCDNFLVSGAEEKILRAFQPTKIFTDMLSEVSDVHVAFKDVPESATLPALGLSNQSSAKANTNETSMECKLDEDFLRSSTLWPEVSKLYGHVYEIVCIATCKQTQLIASASQSTKPQFAAIILWDASSWEKLGDYPFHKLNVTDMEFTSDGQKLLSVSRDRTWAVWQILKVEGLLKYSMSLIESGSFHTRALWVGTWNPSDKYFVTGARDKKLAIWLSTPATESVKVKYEKSAVQTFDCSVSAAAVNEDDVIAVGLESGSLFLLQYKYIDLSCHVEILVRLDKSLAHHATIERLRFNPKEKYQLASGGADRLVKIYQLTPS